MGLNGPDNAPTDVVRHGRGVSSFSGPHARRIESLCRRRPAAPAPPRVDDRVPVVARLAARAAAAQVPVGQVPVVQVPLAQVRVVQVRVVQDRVPQDRVVQDRVVQDREARARIVEEQLVSPGRPPPQVGRRGAKATTPAAIAGHPAQGVPPAEPVLRVPAMALATVTIGAVRAAPRPPAAGVRQPVGARPVAIPGPTPGRNAPSAAPAPAPRIVRIVVRVRSALTGRSTAASVAIDPIGVRAVGGRPVAIACRRAG